MTPRVDSVACTQLRFAQDGAVARQRGPVYAACTFGCQSGQHSVEGCAPHSAWQVTPPLGERGEETGQGEVERDSWHRQPSREHVVHEDGGDGA